MLRHDLRSASRSPRHRAARSARAPSTPTWTSAAPWASPTARRSSRSIGAGRWMPTPAETVGDLKALADDHRRPLVHSPSVELHTCGRADPVKPSAKVRSVSAADAWAAASRGEARLLDLRTAAERRRYGWPPSAPQVSLTRHIAAPGEPGHHIPVPARQPLQADRLARRRRSRGAGRTGSALASLTGPLCLAHRVANRGRREGRGNGAQNRERP